MTVSQAKPYLSTKDDRSFRARRVRIAFFTMYRNLHEWITTEHTHVKARDHAMDEMVRAHATLQSYEVPLDDRCGEELAD